jgi:hypothetical protein
MSPPLSPSELKKLLDSKSVTLLDVRRKADYEAEPSLIPGAAWRRPRTGGKLEPGAAPRQARGRLLRQRRLGQPVHHRDPDRQAGKRPLRRGRPQGLEGGGRWVGKSEVKP